ncbi:MAG: hypothetical protein Q9195_009018 [Heterodermia aff. obscurata]
MKVKPIKAKQLPSAWYVSAHQHLIPIEYTRLILNQTVYVQQIGWTISLGLTIISIQLFYLRLFPNIWLRNTIYGIGVLTIAWLIAVTLTVVLQCNPVRFFWNPKIPGGTCIHTNRFYFAAGLTSTVAIIFVLFLPLPIILRLKTTNTKKFGLAASFILGAFVGVVSIIRLVSLFDIKRDDLTYTSSLPQLWSCVEVSFGVIAACVPSLTPLFLLIFNKSHTRLRKQPYSYENSKQNRPSKGVAKNFSRLEPHDRSHSLELIMMDGQQGESSEVVGVGEAIGGGDIVVTSHVDQVSKERVAEGSGETFGVQAHASSGLG